MQKFIALVCIFLICVFSLAHASEIEINQNLPTIIPVPTVEPESTPTPEPDPPPTTEPEPTPTPEPEPTPTTEPEPTPTPEPDPTPTTEPEPTPTPEPDPTPTTEPEPTPTIEPTSTTVPTIKSVRPASEEYLSDFPVYDVTVSYDESGFAYTFTGEYEGTDYTDVSGQWTDNTAVVTVHCTTDSQPVQVYTEDGAMDAAVCDVITGEHYVSISASDSYTQSSPAILNSGEDVSITYTTSGKIPFDAVLSDGQGGSFSPCNSESSSKSNIPIFTVNVYFKAVTEE